MNSGSLRLKGGTGFFHSQSIRNEISVSPLLQIAIAHDFSLTAVAAEEALAAANEAAKTTAKLVAPRVPKDLPPAKWMPWYQVIQHC